MIIHRLEEDRAPNLADMKGKIRVALKTCVAKDSLESALKKLFLASEMIVERNYSEALSRQILRDRLNSVINQDTPKELKNPAIDYIWDAICTCRIALKKGRPF